MKSRFIVILDSLPQFSHPQETLDNDQSTSINNYDANQKSSLLPATYPVEFEEVRLMIMISFHSPNLELFLYLKFSPRRMRTFFA